jgi:hypothetical protein
MLCLDSFGKTDTLSKMHKKLVSSYALEGLEFPVNRPQLQKIGDLAEELLHGLKGAKVECRPSVDLGTDMRVEEDYVIGSSLIYQDEVLHLALFPKTDEAVANSRIQQPSRRKYFIK